MTKKTITRGDIFFVDFGQAVGSEQGNQRPAVVLQNNIGNRHSPTVIVAPMTSKKKTSMPTHVLVPRQGNLQFDSLVMTEQVRVIDRSRIGKYVGQVCNELQSKIDKALAVSLGMPAASY
jgi:mRNA interferase MazF